MTISVNSSPTLDPSRLLSKVNQRLSYALVISDKASARQCRIVADFLSLELGTVPAQAIAARARAVCRFMERHRHV